ncbi:rhodanese-like domain-containing protein [Roseibium sp.]|uniref:rhodanese-like domain-containing protein n=1 Tax=Roseibium sp. TaxID=1936156 RepID=UPI003D1175D5
MRRWLACVAVFTALSLFGTANTLSQEFVDPTGLVKETSSGDFVVDGVERIDLERAHELYQAGAVFVDLRNIWRYDLAHIRGAVGLELNSQFNEESLAKHASKDQAVVFYCNHSACPRSAIASALALTWGYTDIYHFPDGWSAWSSSDYDKD